MRFGFLICTIIQIRAALRHTILLPYSLLPIHFQKSTLWGSEE